MTQSTTPPDTVTVLREAVQKAIIAIDEGCPGSANIHLYKALAATERAAIQPAGDALPEGWKPPFRVNTDKHEVVSIIDADNWVLPFELNTHTQRALDDAEGLAEELRAAQALAGFMADSMNAATAPPVCTPVQAAPDSWKMTVENTIAYVDNGMWDHKTAIKKLRRCVDDDAPAVQAAPVGMPDMSDDMLTPSQMTRHVRERKQELCDHDYTHLASFGGDICANCGKIKPPPSAPEVKQDASALPPLDGCKMCLGAKGGVPGNENIIGGVVVCDYCTSKLMDMKAAGWFSVPEVKQGALPPLPNNFHVLLPHRLVVYTADQMTAYVLADRAARQPSAVDLLAAVFDAWENGDDCYEEGDVDGSYMGKAFRLDDDVYAQCCDLLNRANPPRNASAYSDHDARVLKLALENLLSNSMPMPMMSAKEFNAAAVAHREATAKARAALDALAARSPVAAPSDEYAGIRLRAVAKIVGLPDGAFSDDDKAVDDCRFSILGMIAGQLRKSAVRQPVAAPTEAPDSARELPKPWHTYAASTIKQQEPRNVRESAMCAEIAALRNLAAVPDSAEPSADRMRTFILTQCIHNLVVADQSAWIEWKHGKGAEAAMEWIENGLRGPGHIPKYNGETAQEYFNVNVDERMDPPLATSSAAKGEA